MEIYENARKFIYRNARPLDIARWNYLFESGKKEDVIKYLMAYQSADGTWNVTWNWDAFPEQWVISKNWWQSYIIIRNIAYVKAFEKDGAHSGYHSKFNSKR